MNPVGEMTAVVVARGGSSRLPRKALQDFHGRTLIAHKVDTLRKVAGLDRVVVGSDDEQILREAEAAGAEIVRRDAFHCDEKVCSANEMIRDMAEKVDTGTILWAHPTNPLVRAATYAAAIEEYLVGLARGHDSLMSVTAVLRHAWIQGQPLNFNPWGERHPFASELPPVCVQDGAIFIQSRQRFLETRYFYGKKPVLFAVPTLEGWDIDTFEDLQVARLLGGV